MRAKLYLLSTADFSILFQTHEFIIKVKKALLCSYVLRNTIKWNDLWSSTTVIPKLCVAKKFWVWQSFANRLFFLRFEREVKYFWSWHCSAYQNRLRITALCLMWYIWTRFKTRRERWFAVGGIYVLMF